MLTARTSGRHRTVLAKCDLDRGVGVVHGKSCGAEGLVCSFGECSVAPKEPPSRTSVSTTGRCPYHSPQTLERVPHNVRVEVVALRLPLHFPVKNLDVAWLRPSSRPGLKRHPGSDLPTRPTRIEDLTHLDIAWMKPDGVALVAHQDHSVVRHYDWSDQTLTIARIWATPEMQHTTILAGRCGERRVACLLDIRARPPDRKKYPLPLPSEDQKTITERRPGGSRSLTAS